MSKRHRPRVDRESVSGSLDTLTAALDNLEGYILRSPERDRPQLTRYLETAKQAVREILYSVGD